MGKINELKEYIEKIKALFEGRADKKDILDIIKIMLLLLIIIVSVIISINILVNRNTVKVDLTVGDTYGIVGVEPQKEEDINNLDEVVQFIVTGNDSQGGMNLTVIANKKGKFVFKVKDNEGHKYKYKFKVEE